MGVPHGHPAWLMVLRVGHCVCVEAGTVDRGGSVPTPVPPAQLCDLCQLQAERSFLASDGTSVVRVGQPSNPQIKAAATARQGPGSGGPDPSIPSPTQRSASGNPQLRHWETARSGGLCGPRTADSLGGTLVPHCQPPPHRLHLSRVCSSRVFQKPSHQQGVLLCWRRPWSPGADAPSPPPGAPGRAAPLRGHPVEPSVPLPRTQGWLLGARLLGPTRPPDQQEEGSRGQCPGGRQPPRGCGERRNRADDTRPCGGRAAGGVAVVPTSKHRYLFFFFFPSIRIKSRTGDRNV